MTPNHINMTNLRKEEGSMYHIDISSDYFEASFVTEGMHYDWEDDSLLVGELDQTMYIPHFSEWKKVTTNTTTTYINDEKGMKIMIF